MAESATVDALVERFSAEWQVASRHPFLDAVADGSLPTTAFDAWLAQDYLFVGDLLVFQARLLARAPRPAQAVLVAGLAALEAELGWFEAHAAQRGLELGVAREPTTERYQTFLESLGTAPYAVAIAGLWAVERAYLDAWSGAAPGAPAFREFVEHWTVPAFAAYVDGLARAANQALSEATPDEQADAVAAVLEVAHLESDFWQMAWSGGS